MPDVALIPPPLSPIQSRPRLAVTLGDPAGIGPEVVLKALANLRSQLPPFPALAPEITLVGDRRLWQRAYQTLKPKTTVPLADPETWPRLDVPVTHPEQIQVGQETAASGAVSFAALVAASQAAQAGDFDAVVTAPIAKSAWKAAGHLYPGQTELLAEVAGVTRFGMLFVARSPHTGWQLRTLLATTHIPLAQVPQTLTPDLMSQKLDLLLDCLQRDFGLARPRIAIAGLNPHSGEQGQLGREEQDWLIPWLDQQRQRYPQVTLTGPVPPDTLWVAPGQAWFQPGATAHDAYLALYHDQGLIPVKLLAFDRAVNTTIGLPFVRTSPDHGTAFDIAGRGIADATSFSEALTLAAALVGQRQAES
jgi:4-hydroxythreonine-4-phosphate dehydrogenase